MITKTFFSRSLFVVCFYLLASLTGMAQIFIDEDSAYYAAKAAQIPFSRPVENKIIPNVVNAKNNFTNRAFNVSGNKGAEPGSSLSNCYFAPDASYSTFAGNDDGSIGPFALPFGFNLFGTIYNQFWINNNGNITFTGALSTFTASGFPITTPMVAPFWSDVDTRIGNLVRYKINPTNVIVTWPGVGYYLQHTNLLNTFQLIITNGSDPLIGIGNNVAFNYGDMQWTTGDASGGAGGFGGTPATVGINKGDNLTYIQVGRFGVNSSAYDGPLGATDGINYLDNQCFQFNIGNFGNLPPTVNGNPPNNTITIPCGQTGTISLQALPPEVGQSVTASVNTGGLCNTVVNTTNGASATAVVNITGAACNVGTHNISFTFTDNFSTPGVTTVNITVIVQSCCVPPTITCPSNITVNNSQGQCGANVSYTATATGTSPTITYSPASGSFFPVGTTTVTATATNACGTASCQFTVTVVDAQAPVITCPSNITVSAASGQCGANICYQSPRVVENCPPVTPAGYTLIASLGGSYYYQSNAQSDYATAENNAYAAGGHLAVITSAAENSAINAGGGGFAWIGGNDLKQDGTWEWITCEQYGYSNFCGGEPNGGTFENHLEFESGGCWNDLFAGASRYSILEIEVASIVQTAGLRQNAFFPVGTTTNTFVATDASGNTSTCSFNVTVTDDENPVLTCPADVVHGTDPDVCSYSFTPGPATATDNCPGVTVSGVRSDNRPLIDPYPVGVTTIIWTATDAHNHSVSCVQTITVTDDEAPVISCPADVNHTADAGLCSYRFIPAAATASDNCPGVTVSGVRSDLAGLGDPYPVGVTAITWTATDAHNHSVSCVQRITVTDDEAPVISCPTDVNHTADAGLCSYSFIPAAATATDNCPGVTVSGVRSDLAGLGDPYPVGPTTITWTATDAHNHSVSCVQTITVTDDEAPSITCAPNQAQTADEGVCNAYVTVVGPTTGDNCGVAGVTNSYTHTSNASGNYPVGTTTITWTVTDIHGNTNTCTQTITVTDDEMPSITCAPNQSQTADPGVCNARVTVAGPATGDNCGVAGVTNSYTHTSDASGTYPVGTTTVTWTVTDIHGNSSTCTQTITVTDNEPPVISVQNILSCFAANNFGCAINLGATATDNCGLLSLTSNAPACFPVGTTTVTWTARDIHGNTSTATQLVTRNPEININICAGITRTIYIGVGPQSINLTSTVTGGTPGYTYSWSPAAGLNNANTANPVASPIAPTTYTLTVTDSKGCTRSLSIFINVLPLSSAVCSGSGNNVKFSVCHIPPGNPSNPQNICISANALPAHLTSGSNGHNNCYLGPCGQQLCFSTLPGAPNFVQVKGVVEETVETPVIVDDPKEESTESFKVNAYPNPSAGEFSLMVTSSSMEPITVRIMDMTGAVRSVSNVVSKTNMIRVGANLPGGTYMAEVMQGQNKQVIKLVKLN